MYILPVIKVGQKLYFVDERLHQYRSAVPFPEVIEFIDFGQQPWERVEWICYHDNFAPGVGCPDCHFTDVITVREEAGGGEDEPSPEDGGCMFDHDHSAHPDECERHD
jgi:hypothetical protein